MDSYKRGNYDLQKAKRESHLLPSGKKFEPSSVLKG
jgi:hypothetical protein